MRTVIAIMGMFCLLLAACSKDKKNTSPDNNQQNTDQLTDQEKELIGTWIWISTIDTTYSDITKEYTITELIQDCERDNEYTFKTDKTYWMYAGKDSSCNEKSHSYEWKFNGEYLLFPDGPSIRFEEHKYYKLDATRFALQGYTPHAYGWGKRTNIYKRR